MRLGQLTNGIACEYDMQDAFKKWIFAHNKREHKRKEHSYYYKPNYIYFGDEVRVREVRRRADFLLNRKRRLINVEAKCTDWKCLFKQLQDHATYCDYCFAYIPDYAPTPQWFKRKLAEKGYGLIIYNYTTEKVTEVLEAHQNKKLNRTLRSKMLRVITKRQRKSNK